jgi:hypothetical protein
MLTAEVSSTDKKHMLASQDVRRRYNNLAAEVNSGN